MFIYAKTERKTQKCEEQIRNIGNIIIIICFEFGLYK